MGAFTINILHHRDQPTTEKDGCMITQLAKQWEQKSCTVNHLYGCDDYVPADVLILHVNLSCIPQEYLNFARRFPATINIGLTDIRKRTISRHLVTQTDTYEGPVIVKTDLNCGGSPERQLGIRPKKSSSSLIRRIKRALKIKDPASMRKPSDYIVYSSKAKVPKSVFSNHALIVEKFLPEKHGNEYYQRRYYFLRDAEYNEIHTTSVSIHAGDSDDHCIRYWEEPSIPEALRTYLKALKADYGKIDYVIHEGEVIIFDVNRTPSCGNIATDPYVAEWALSIAERLHLGVASHSQTLSTQPV